MIKILTSKDCKNFKFTLSLTRIDCQFLNFERLAN